MDKTHAQQQLRIHRSAAPDTSREMAEAVSQANQDPELMEWFLEQQRFNKVVGDGLRDIPVPHLLKERIMAAQKPIIPLWRKHLLKFAAAAAVVGLLTVAMVWLPGGKEETTFAGFQNRMVGFALREYRMDIVSEDAEAIRQFLQKQGAPSDYTLPLTITSLRPMGGARLSWQGRPVAMLCYKLGKSDTAYLFMVKQGDISGNKTFDRTALFGLSKGLTTASWQRGDTIYFLAAPIPESELKGLVQDIAAQYEYPGGASAMLVRWMSHLKSSDSL